MFQADYLVVGTRSGTGTTYRLAPACTWIYPAGYAAASYRVALESVTLLLSADVETSINIGVYDVTNTVWPTGAPLASAGPFTVPTGANNYMTFDLGLSALSKRAENESYTTLALVLSNLNAAEDAALRWGYAGWRRGDSRVKPPVCTAGLPGKFTADISGVLLEENGVWNGMWDFPGLLVKAKYVASA